MTTKKTTIEELRQQGRLSTRTYNALRYAELMTVADILRYEAEGLFLGTIRNLGRKGVTEIQAVMSDEILDELPKPKSPYELLSDELREIIDRAFADTRPETLNTGARIYARYAGPGEFYNSYREGTYGAMEIQPTLTKEENVAYRKWHIEMAKAIIYSLVEAHADSVDECAYATQYRDELLPKYAYFTISETITHFISDETDEAIQKEYDMLCQRTLSVRALNFKKNAAPRYKDIVPYFDKSLEEFSKLSGLRGIRKTLAEFYDLMLRFRDLHFAKYEQYTDHEYMRKQILQKEMPYMDEEQCSFISKHISSHGHKPLLYILYHYLRASERRECRYFCLYHGLKDGHRYNLEEIAEMDGVLTGERVRQIITDRHRVLDGLEIRARDLDYYTKYFGQKVITSISDVYLTLSSEESLPDDFYTFCALFSQISHYDIVDVTGCVMLTIPSLRKHIDIKSIITRFNREYHRQKIEDRTLPITFIAPEADGDYAAEVRDIILMLASDKDNVSVLADSICFSQNKMNLEQELTHILQEAGHPLHIEEIFARFKAQYPHHKYADSSKLRPYLQRAEHIQAIGKQSTYGLDSWDHIFFGNIRDLMYSVLKDSEEPMHISDIFKAVSEHFPDTNIKSLIASMAIDTYSRFVLYEDSYYGLKEREYPSAYVAAQGVPRYKFDQRLEMFREFVEANHRFPFFNGGDEEASLQHWLYNVTHSNIDISEQERVRLEAMLAEYAGMEYPQTATEYVFYTRCQDYKKYIGTYHRLPSSTVGQDLYQWFNRSKDNVRVYRDRRAKYFRDLCDYITSSGLTSGAKFQQQSIPGLE